MKSFVQNLLISRAMAFSVLCIITAVAAPTTARAGDPPTATATDTATETPEATATDTATETPETTATDTATETPEATATPTATDTATETPEAAPTATSGTCPGLDVDGNGQVQGATDGVYIFRHLLGLNFIVPPSFRMLDGTIADDETIAANIDALGAGLDVDGNSQIQASTDGVYIFRHLLGLQTIVPASFRALDPSIADDATIAANIDALCGGS